MAKKQTGKDLVKWDEELAKLAKQTKKGLKAAEGKFISFSGGKMSFAGVNIPDDELECVIVGWVYHNAYYDPDVRYDPKNPQSPICYAFGDDEDTMEPSDSSPEKQCGSCAECPFNQFESAKSGRGKACKNTFRLALIAKDDLDDITNAEVVYASIPPKSLKNWAKYVAGDLDKLERPHWSVITKMTRVPDDESQFRVLFQCEEKIEDSKLFAPLKALWEKTMKGIDFPYTVRDNVPVGNRKTEAKKKPQKFARR